MIKQIQLIVWNIWNLEWYNNKILFYDKKKKDKWRSIKNVPSQYQDISAWMEWFKFQIPKYSSEFFKT